MSSSSSSDITAKTTHAITATQEKFVELFKKCGPLFVTIGQIINVIEPYIEQVINIGLAIWKQLEPYHPEELFGAVFGIFLCFFGGHYVITLAAIEAYRMCGWDRTYKYLKMLWEDYKVVREASKKDDKLDEDNDGIADVNQISKQELFTRKLKLAAKSCNPEKLSMALGGLYTGFMGVVATLRVQFAQTITLGAVIGGTFSPFFQKILTPVLEVVVPADYVKWIPVVIDMVCRSIGVSIAWFVQRVISAFYSAVRGAQLVSRGVLSYATRHGYMDTHLYDEGSIHFAVMTVAVGAAGFLWQISNFMQLPFPFNIVFFPLTIVEWFLQYFVSFN